jgi:hypothetical protein
VNTRENNANKMTGEFDSNMPDANGLTEAQVAHYVTDLLDDHAQHLTAVTAKRLSVARSLAVSQLARQQTQAVNHSGNVLAWFGGQIEHHRAMSVAVVVGAMLLAFLAAQHFSGNTNLENSDAFLLASDLPPEAYADKGFDTWLDSKRD